MNTNPSITCPVCQMTSYNPNDIRQGYCGNCHAWTGPQTQLDNALIPGRLKTEWEKAIRQTFPDATEAMSDLILLQRRSPMEKAGYLLACLTRGTTNAEDYDFTLGILVVEAILDAAGLTAAPVGAVKYKPCCTWCAARFEIHTDRAAAIKEATTHIEHARGHVVELREVIV